MEKKAGKKVLNDYVENFVGNVENKLKFCGQNFLLSIKFCGMLKKVSTC